MKITVQIVAKRDRHVFEVLPRRWVRRAATLCHHPGNHVSREERHIDAEYALVGS
jgi:hypothetical protein